MSSLVNALELGGQWEEAVVRFDELRERGVLPNAICFNAAISALAKGSEVLPSPALSLALLPPPLADHCAANLPGLSLCLQWLSGLYRRTLRSST